MKVFCREHALAQSILQGACLCSKYCAGSIPLLIKSILQGALLCLPPTSSFMTCGGSVVFTSTTIFKKCGVELAREERYILKAHFEPPCILDTYVVLCINDSSRVCFCLFTHTSMVTSPVKCCVWMAHLASMCVCWISLIIASVSSHVLYVDVRVGLALTHGVMRLLARPTSMMW